MALNNSLSSWFLYLLACRFQGKLDGWIGCKVRKVLVFKWYRKCKLQVCLAWLWWHGLILRFSRSPQPTIVLTGRGRASFVNSTFKSSYCSRYHGKAAILSSSLSMPTNQYQYVFEHCFFKKEGKYCKKREDLVSRSQCFEWLCVGLDST